MVDVQILIVGYIGEPARHLALSTPVMRGEVFPATLLPRLGSDVGAVFGLRQIESFSEGLRRTLP
jgi:hypothetical protein